MRTWNFLWYCEIASDHNRDIRIILRGRGNGLTGFQNKKTKNELFVPSYCVAFVYGEFVRLQKRLSALIDALGKLLKQQRTETFNDNHQTTAQETRAYGRFEFSLVIWTSDFSELAFYHFRAPSTGQISEKNTTPLNISNLSNAASWRSERNLRQEISVSLENRFEKNRYWPVCSVGIYGQW